MIWCVEDDASIRDIELYALTSTGFEARGFDDGASFWEALQTETPELILLDVMLPGEDGVSLLKKMKAAPALRDIHSVASAATKSQRSATSFARALRSAHLTALATRSTPVTSMPRFAAAAQMPMVPVPQ